MLLNAFTTTAQLAFLLGVSSDTLKRLAFDLTEDEKYGLMNARKRNGDIRVIRIPSKELKYLQRKLLPLLEELYRPASHAHGYIAKRGLRSNATPHIAKRYVLNLDLTDFFGTVNFGRVRGRLRAAPYNLSNAVATTIARLATCEGRLPMGAPTSPILSNIICSGLDSALSRLARNHGCFYTRYADDLTFSSNRKSFPHGLAVRGSDTGKAVTTVGHELESIIADQGFAVNAAKTRLLYQSDRQEVCGIVCNQRLNTLPKLRRQIRAALHAWRKFGLTAASKEWNDKFNFRHASSFETSLRGKIEFLKHIRGDSDAVVIKCAKQFNELRSSDTAAIPFVEIEDLRSRLKRTACCVDAYMANSDKPEDMNQGSGFLIKGAYIVTNRHVVVVNNQVLDDISVSFPGSSKLSFAAKVVAQLPSRDLALLRVQDEDWNAMQVNNYCDVSDVSAERDDVIWLAGWPNYHSGDELHYIQSNVLGFAVRNQTSLFRISANIVEGNSGGPVFNEQGQVVGIATFGSSAADAPFNVFNGCLPASLIGELLAQLP